MNDIFVSYRRSDSSWIVGHLLDRLEATFGRQHIFRDVESIDYGQDFGSVINQALASCEVMLVIIGDDWIGIQDDLGTPRLQNSEDWVRIEVSKALERGIHVIPVLVEPAEMPSKDQLPENLKPLATRNSARLRGDPDFDGDTERLFEAIAKCLSRTPSTARRSLVKRVVLAIAMVVILSALTLMQAWPKQDETWLHIVDLEGFPFPARVEARVNDQDIRYPTARR